MGKASGTDRRNFLKTAAAMGIVASLENKELAASPSPSAEAKYPHPHLYYQRHDLPRLRAEMEAGVHGVIWKNLQASAEEYLTFKPPTAIPHGRPDIQYHDLYVTFYHSMFTLAILHHFTFCYVVSHDRRYFEQAQSWMQALLGWERTWGPPYLYSRYLLGSALYYDCLYDEIGEYERQQIRDMLTSQMEKYEAEVLVPRLKNASFSTHHATIYYCGAGVTACALLGEVPQAQHWLDLVKEKFEGAILPFGFGIDGGHQEGMTFWASQNHYRFFFLDALKNTTGEDFYEKYHYDVSLPIDWGIHSYMGGKVPAKDLYETNEYVCFSADYGQMNYSAPALLRFASAYRDPHAQWVALRDPDIGKIQRTGTSVVGYREDLLFALGPFSYLWYDPSVEPQKPIDLPLARHFRGAEQVMMRNSWEDDQLFFGIEGRAPGSQGALDFVIHYQGETLATYQQLKDRNPFMNHLSPNTIEFGGVDQLDATVREFFLTPNYAYTCVDAYRFQRYVFYVQPGYIVIIDEINVDDPAGGDIKWELYSMGDMKVVGPGQVSLARRAAHMILQAVSPATANYEIVREQMYRTVGDGAVQVTVDLNEYPHLLLPLGKQPAGAISTTSPYFMNVFYPEGAIDPSSVKGGKVGDAAYLRLNGTERQDLLLFRLGRVAFAEETYTDAKSCLVQHSGNELAGFGLQKGSVLLRQGRPLFQARNWFCLGARVERSGVKASFKAETGGDIGFHCPCKPTRVLVNGSATKFSYENNQELVRIFLPPGEGTLQAYC